MKQLKFWFVFIMTLITVFAVLLIGDTVIAGIVYLIITIWDKVLALKVFKWSVALMFFIQALFTAPLTLRVLTEEGEDESGT